MKLRTMASYEEYITNLFIKNNITYSIELKTEKSYEDSIMKYHLPPCEPICMEHIVIFTINPKDKAFIQSLLNQHPDNHNYINYNIVKPKVSYRMLSYNIPKYPIYIVSYKRYDIKKRLTWNFLEEMQIPYYICVQEQEKIQYEQMVYGFKYCIAIITSTNTTEGSYIQRNTCLSHSSMQKCWILDDNIQGWYYYNLNQKIQLNHSIIFNVLENIMDHTNNIGIISHCYYMDVPSTTMRSPIQVNTKNYSSCLINRDLLLKHNIQFRLKYNEDVDLTIQCLSQQIQTISTNIFLCNKLSTGSVAGGNTDIYDNKMHLKYQCLEDTWKHLPLGCISKTTTKHKDNRVHHKVNYRKICKYFNTSYDIAFDDIPKKYTYEDFGIKLIL